MPETVSGLELVRDDEWEICTMFSIAIAIVESKCSMSDMDPDRFS